MEKKQCKDCAHFCQHYALDKRKIYWIYCGHCKQGKVKSKRPDAAACDNFQQGDRDEAAFVSKEYLSKELLRYLLNLELLPPIENANRQP